MESIADCNRDAIVDNARSERLGIVVCCPRYERIEHALLVVHCPGPGFDRFLDFIECSGNVELVGREYRLYEEELQFFPGGASVRLVITGCPSSWVKRKLVGDIRSVSNASI